MRGERKKHKRKSQSKSGVTRAGQAACAWISTRDSTSWVLISHLGPGDSVPSPGTGTRGQRALPGTWDLGAVCPPRRDGQRSHLLRG